MAKMTFNVLWPVTESRLYSPWYGVVVETRQDGLLMDMLLAHVTYLRNGADGDNKTP